MRPSSSAAAFIDWVLLSMRSKSVTSLIRRSGASWAFSSFSSLSLTSSNDTDLPGSILLTRTTCQPSGDWMGAGATPGGRPKMPSASGPGGRSFLVTRPSLITPSALPRTSLAASSSDLPAAAAAMMALALSSLSAIAWSTSRFSGVPNSAERASYSCFSMLGGHRHLGQDVVDGQQDVGEGAVFGDLELGLVGLEIGVELLGRGLGHVDDDGVGHVERLGDALLAFHLEDVVAQRLGREPVGTHHAEQLVGGDLAAHVGDVLRLADARLLQAVAVEQGIERAAGALEGRIARDGGAHLGVAHDQAELLDGIVEHGALDDLLQGAHMQAVAQRLLGLRPLAGLALDVLELAVELVAHLVDGDRGAADPAIDRDVRAADMGDFGAASAHPQHVADAPQAEADDQHAEEHGQDDIFGVFAELIHGAGRVVDG